MTNASYIGGELLELENCYVFIPNFGKVRLYSLPDLGDGKGASYNDEPSIGRSSPAKTYSHSDNRSISAQIHLFVRKKSDVYENIAIIRAIQSCTYPRNSQDAPFLPPPVCRIRCGRLLADKELCVVLKNYSIKYPTDVPWDEETYLPHKVDIDTTWEVVYRSSNLPGQDRIIREGS